jgi:hypothetical protein
VNGYGKLADGWKAEAQKNYGTPGPEFLRRIFFRFGLKKTERQLEERVAAFVKEVVPKGSDGQVMRVAKAITFCRDDSDRGK